MARQVSGTMPACLFLVLGCFGLLAAAAGSGEQERGRELDAAIEAALGYLSLEVPGWERENGCFSCHNNGDAARALYAAALAGWDVADATFAGTNDWLARPTGWVEQAGEPGVRDLRLAQIQFASALQAGVDARLLLSGPASTAARGLLSFQREDGSWAAESEATVGSPATYGEVLATAMAVRVLLKNPVPGAAEAVGRARLWLESRPAVATVDVAAGLIAMQSLEDSAPQSLERVETLIAAQGSDGGWGPYPHSASEPFDTAISVIALLAEPSASETRQAAAAGTAFLIREQLPQGGWLETTRPAGGESYAQHISTTAWATMALIEARSQRAD